MSALLQELPARWRADAEVLRRRHAPAQADLLDALASELEGAYCEWEGEALTLGQAAAESGYSADHLSRLLRDGRIPNAGRPNAPRILRRDLPRKAGVLADVTASRQNGGTAIVRSVINEGADDG